MIAHEPGRSQVIIGALTGYDLVVVSTLDAAVSLIKEDGIKLFVIGVHFDESRAIELVNEIRKDRKHKSTPIVLLRQSSIRITSLLRTTIDSLKKVGTVSEYLEVENNPEPGKAIRDSISRLLRGNNINRSKKS